jgi:hypothetical protein
MNKQELIDRIEQAHSDWQSLLTEVGESHMEEPGVTGDWSVKDIIAHIAAWEQRVLDRVESEAKGTPLEMSDWDLDKMNERFYERSRDRSLADVLDEASAVHARFMDFVRSLSEDELFKGGRYKWTEGEPFYHWVEGNSYGHYEEHAGPIRAWLNESLKSKV